MTTETTRSTPGRPSMTVGEWVNAAGFVLAVYVVIGLVWADGHADTRDVVGLEKMASYALHVVAWPLLVFFDLDVLGLHLT